jgi:spore maturation protein CgeB
MYQGSLDAFYLKNPAAINLSYKDNLNMLLEDTTEFAGSYLRAFRKLNVEAACTIANDNNLMLKWISERGLNHEKNWEIIFNQIKSFSPDVLMIENLSLVSDDLLKHIRGSVKNLRLIVANHCAPFNSKVLNSLKGVDFVITCTPGLKAHIEALGKKSYLVYHGFDPEVLKRTASDISVPQKDLVFSGSLISGGDFHSRRISLIERMLKESIPVDLYINLEKTRNIRAKQLIFLFFSFIKKLNMEGLFSDSQLLQYGNTRVDSYSHALLKLAKSPVYGIDMFNLFLNSKIILNFHIGIAGEYAGNMRMFEATGIGSCLLTDNKINMRDLFDTDTEVVVYDNEADCIAKAKWLLENEDERMRIAARGHQKTLRYHTVENRCRSIIDIINTELLLRGKSEFLTSGLNLDK